MARARSINAYKVGDWDKARLVLGSMAAAHVDFRTSIRTNAEMLQWEIRAGIVSGQYASEFGWLDITDYTRNSRIFPDNPILQDTGQYLDSIRVMRLSGGFNAEVWGVGVPRDARNSDGDSLVVIGLKHEYGKYSIDGTVPDVPARPFWKKEYERAGKRLYEWLLEDLRKKTLGLTDRQVRSFRSRLAGPKGLR
jgi:hypothetical protein